MLPFVGERLLRMKRKRTESVDEQTVLTGGDDYVTIGHSRFHWKEGEIDTPRGGGLEVHGGETEREVCLYRPSGMWSYAEAGRE